jgi:tellurite resistance protein TerC
VLHSGTPGLWLLFFALIGGTLWIDIGLLHKRAKVMSFKEAVLWSIIWLCLAMAFNGAIWDQMGSEKAMQFLAGYLLEMSLSVDNMFVFVMIFTHFSIEPQYQPRVLHWGIIGAQIMRLIFIMGGVALIHAFHWMVYVLGALLVLTGIKMLLHNDDDKPDIEQNIALKVLKKFLPVTTKLDGQNFLTVENGRSVATPLMAALAVIEVSDVVFALDSVPAIIAITPDPFIVYTSNIFAISGLRALYFLLSHLVDAFRYLKHGVSIILIFVGVKMLGEHFYKVPISISLLMIGAILAISILASLAADRADRDRKQKDVE